MIISLSKVHLQRDFACLKMKLLSHVFDLISETLPCPFREVFSTVGCYFEELVRKSTVKVPGKAKMLLIIFFVPWIR